MISNEFNRSFQQAIKNASDMQSIFQHTDTITKVHNSLLKTYTPILQIIQQYENMFRKLDTVYNFSMPATNTMDLLNSVFAPFNLKTTGILSESFLKSIPPLEGARTLNINKLQKICSGISSDGKEYIIADESLEIVSEVFCNQPQNTLKSKNNEQKTNSVSKEFVIGILLQILIALATIAHNQYLADKEDLEAQKLSLKNELYQEKQIKLEEDNLAVKKELLDYLQQIVKSLNDDPESQQSADKCQCQGSPVLPADQSPLNSSPVPPECADNNHE